MNHRSFRLAPVVMAGEPERGVPRLFVGNLVPSITDDALRRALARYGTVRSLERKSRYAHVGLLPPAGQPVAVDRAVAALNNTKWAGTELRVERAREHYLTRLRREWEEAAEVEKHAVRLDCVSADTPGSMKDATLVGKWKGSRVCFAEKDEPDVAVCGDDEIMTKFDDDDLVLIGKTEGLRHGVFGDDSSLGSDSASDDMGDQVSLEMRREEDVLRDVSVTPPSSPLVISGKKGVGVIGKIMGNSSPARTSVSDPDSKGIPGPVEEYMGEVDAQFDVGAKSRSESKNRRESQPMSAAVESTVALFGLDDDSPPPLRVKSSGAPGDVKRERDRKTEISEAKAKRQRLVYDDRYDEDAIAAEDDPARLDTSRERKLARGVLASMFPDAVTTAGPGEALNSDEQALIAERLRKPALFRDIWKSVRERDGRGTGKNKEGTRIPIKGAAKKFAKYAGKPTSKLRPQSGTEMHVRQKAGGKDMPGQRPGLFRSLL